MVSLFFNGKRKKKNNKKVCLKIINVRCMRLRIRNVVEKRVSNEDNDNI